MNYFLKISSYLFHPILMPILGAFLYYRITPKYIESDIIQAKTLDVNITTL